MTPDERQYVINELQKVIDETHIMLSRFEATGMDEVMREDYDKLLAILDDAVKQQHQHTKVLLSVSDLPVR